MLKKPVAALICFQATLCLVSAYLISKISLIGKIGIALFYKEYKLLRSGWKTFLLFFFLQLLIIFIMHFMNRRYSVLRTIYMAIIILIISIIGLVTTYYDFLHTYSHRLLKERFHIGFYLFWIGVMITCVFYIFVARNKPAGAPVEASDNSVNLPQGE